MEEIVRGAAKWIMPAKPKGPIVDKREVRKYRNIPNASPDHKTTMYLRIPPPTEKSLAVETFYNTNYVGTKRVINKKSLKIEYKTDDSENADVTSEDEPSSHSDDEMLYRRKH
jgi:hypothetical protein